MEKKKGKNVLVGVTGSVAAIKVPELVQKLTGFNGLEVSDTHFDCYLEKINVLFLQLNVQVVTTKAALHFFNAEAIPVKCYKDEEEWVGFGYD
jgi:phosphopantothenoylcysteine decarboxylase